MSKFKKLYYKIRRGVIRVKDFFVYDIKHFCQRGRRGWSNRDSWNINYYFLETHIGMLKNVIKHGLGYPSELTPKQWKKVLAKMLEGFEAKKKIFDDEHYYEPEDEEMPNNPMKCIRYKDGREGGTIQFTPEAKAYFKKCGYDAKLIKKWNKQFKKAMELYIKYFDSLWD